MYDNLEDAMDATVTAAQARREVERHGADWSEFVSEVGERSNYTGEQVLGWLGY